VAIWGAEAGGIQGWEGEIWSEGLGLCGKENSRIVVLWRDTWFDGGGAPSSAVGGEFADVSGGVAAPEPSGRVGVR